MVRRLRVTFYEVRLPLVSPYELSLGRFEAFRGILCRAENREGRTGWGESMPLPGYSREDLETVWGRFESLALQFGGGQRPVVESHPFTWASLVTALEHLLLLQDKKISGDFSLVDTLSLAGEGDPAARLPPLIEKGCCRIKVKVGMSGVEEDIRGVNRLAEALPPGVLLRVDANQAYTLEEARQFLSDAETQKIEYFEQPFPRERWDWVRSLAYEKAPLLLDESVWTLEDLPKAQECGVGAVKLKLFKQGSPSRSVEMIKRAQDLGLQVVWGNGFQGEIGCWHEFLVAETCGIQTPLESNGFLKLREPLLETESLAKGGSLALSEERLESVTVRKKQVLLAEDEAEKFIGLKREKRRGGF